MQAMNVTRNAWLTAGLPMEVAATTVDAQCGSSQQATNLAYAMVASGVVDAAVACGVELMSRVPMGSTIPKDPNVGKPVNKNYWAHYEFTSQFEGAERIAETRGLTRADCDAFGKQSQDRAGACVGRGPLRHPDPRDRRTRCRRRREAARHDPPGRAGRGPARDHDRGSCVAQADRPSRRRAHRGHVVADRGRRWARCCS